MSWKFVYGCFYCDNYYTSKELFVLLKLNGENDATGSARKFRDLVTKKQEKNDVKKLLPGEKLTKSVKM